MCISVCSLITGRHAKTVAVVSLKIVFFAFIYYIYFCFVPVVSCKHLKFCLFLKFFLLWDFMMENVSLLVYSLLLI